MLFAIVNGEKVEATPKTKGICPLCDKEVFSKCGDIYIWHWAHTKDINCDSWWEPETEWHKNWKLVFGKDNSEIIIKKNEVKHIADIQTKEGFIIELQNSPIQKRMIQARENFYGEKMFWIINGKQFKENFNIESFQLTSPGLIEDEEYYRLHHPLAKLYDTIDDVRFTWNSAHRTWNEVKRRVFIDFGDENLFWVKKGMGSKWGQGQKISKEKFIVENGGDLTLLNIVIDKS